MNIQSRFIVFPLPWLAGLASFLMLLPENNGLENPAISRRAKRFRFPFLLGAREEDALDDLNFSR